MKEITAITPNGIDYIDEDGNKQFLDFEICFQNFLINQRKGMGSEYVDAHKEFYKKWKSVGVRHTFGNPPTIIFFTIPQTVFEFLTWERLGEVEYMIRKVGYRTTDGD